MYKAELRSKRTLNATREMIEKAKNNKQTGTTKSNGLIINYNMAYGLFLRCQLLKGILKVAVFFPKDLANGIKTAKYEIFINTAGDEYITRILDEQGEEIGWTGAMIHNLPGVDTYEMRWKCKKEAYINQEGYTTIKKLLEVNEGGYGGIRQYQERIRKAKILEAEKRQQAPWDADMKLVPERPKAFDKWMAKEVSKDNYIFYEYQRKGATTGYCTYCEKEVPLKMVPKHLKEGSCSVCKRSITFLSKGKRKEIWTGTDCGQLLQAIENGFVIREFSVQKHYYAEPEKNYVRIHESDRYLCRNGAIDYYSWELYKNKYTRWCKSTPPRYYHYRDKCKIYKKNIKSIEKKIERHSALPIIIRNGVEISAYEYIISEAGNPAVEMLVKIGMIRMAVELIKESYDCRLLNESETELPKILKLDKSRLRRLKNMDSGMAGLRWMQLEKLENTLYDDEMIDYFDKADIEPIDLKFVFKKMTVKKIYNYLRKQEQITGERPEQLVTTWRDYLNMAFRAKMDTKLEMIFKPSNLNTAHSEVIEIMERDGMEKLAKTIRKKFPKVDEVCKSLGKYEWEEGKYTVVAPKDVIDIVREGTILRHCIHTCDYYFDRISNREAYLLFLRKKDTPNTPWYTMEVEPGGNIRQKRTTGDNQNPDFEQAVGFLKKWQQVIQKRLSEEDKELALISDQKRKENYSNLRKNENRIWHGKLQGKLLADVLEQDFMSVI